MLRQILFSSLLLATASDVILELPHTSMTFNSLQAHFGPRLTDGGYTGTLKVASPLYACERFLPLPGNSTAKVALVKRGPPSAPCDYGVKVGCPRTKRSG